MAMVHWLTVVSVFETRMVLARIRENETWKVQPGEVFQEQPERGVFGFLDVQSR